MKKYYDKHKQRNLCVNCLKPKESEEASRCNTCAEERRIKRREERKKRKEGSLCIYCESPVKDRGACVKCTEYFKNNKDKWDCKARENNLCLNCGSPRSGVERHADFCEPCFQSKVTKFKNYYENQKLIVIEHYKGACSCCQESNKSFLTIDHLNNDGGAFRKSTRQNILNFLIQNEFPPNHGLSCFNCNCGRFYNGGECPHEVGYILRSKYIEMYKDVVFGAYHNKCACCGENNRGFLTIDHILNDGAKHRRDLNGSHLLLWAYKEIIKGVVPANLQLLCWNCNSGKKTTGVCPHQEVDKC